VFSMPLMVLALFFFFAAIGWATFVENDFGRVVAYKWIYAANWFTGLLVYLSLSLIYNIFRFKMLKWKKMSSLLFHLSFLVIVLGALVTRVIGFEGVMMIREGESSNQIISQETYLQVKAHDQIDQYVAELPIIIDTNDIAVVHEGIEWKHPFSFLFDHNNYFEHEFDFKEHQVSIKSTDVFKNPVDTLIPTAGGDRYLELVVGGMQSNFVKDGEVFVFESGLKVAYNNDTYTDAIKIFETDSGLMFMSPFDMSYFQMSDQSQGMLTRDSVQPFIPKRLYQLGGEQFVFKQYYLGAVKEVMPSTIDKKGLMGLQMDVTVDGVTEKVVVKGAKGVLPTINFFTVNGLNFEVGYGSKTIDVPFYIHLRDFQLENYPGTMNPASFASEVTLIDPAINLEDERRIFMNNVLDYGGYRFFQSSYDNDLKGTILSVNHDRPGTILTYIGYFLLGLGFLINLVSPNGRFRMLISKLVKSLKADKAAAALLFLLSVGGFQAHAEESMLNEVDAVHAEKFSRLVMMSHNGRFVPVHTIADELVRKIHRGQEYKGQNPMQIFLGIHTNPAWYQEPFVYVSGTALRDEFNLDGKYAALSDFLTFHEGETFYLLAEQAEAARIKKPAQRNQYDKDVLKTDERLNIMFGLFNYSYLKLFPKPNDSLNFWYAPTEFGEFSDQDSTFADIMFRGYLQAVNQGYQSDNWKIANDMVGVINTYQLRNTPDGILPSADDIELEIWYNEAGIFKRVMYIYLLGGLLLLIIFFVDLLIKDLLKRVFSEKVVKVLSLSKKVFSILSVVAIVLAGIYQGYGLGVRWYLSGHAPWSDGYEAMVWIAFVAVLLGMFFLRLTKLVLAICAFFAWLLLFVAHMNFMDPEITQLVPVLQSYWLMIHVAIITGSYAFLGIGSFISFLAMFGYSLMFEGNYKRVQSKMEDLTKLSEIIITIGLFMLTIGTFLGGVWANESWGRYWGWDAKETWALASVLIYAILLHIRFIPFMKSKFTFNLLAFWLFGSIIMTFFGVNFYLSGLHSYAKGDPIPIPDWVPITIGNLIIFSALAYYGWLRAKKYRQEEKIQNEE